MKPLCATRPADWWDLADDGNRLALLICGVCPALPRCAQTNRRPHGVLLAGVAYSDAGVPLPLCGCGYPHTTYKGGALTPCKRCSVPDVRIMSRRAYWRERGRRRRAAAKEAA